MWFFFPRLNNSKFGHPGCDIFWKKSCPKYCANQDSVHEKEKMAFYLIRWIRREILLAKPKEKILSVRDQRTFFLDQADRSWLPGLGRLTIYSLNQYQPWFYLIYSFYLYYIQLITHWGIKRLSRCVEYLVITKKMLFMKKLYRERQLGWNIQA